MLISTSSVLLHHMHEASDHPLECTSRRRLDDVFRPVGEKLRLCRDFVDSKDHMRVEDILRITSFCNDAVP